MRLAHDFVSINSLLHSERSVVNCVLCSGQEQVFLEMQASRCSAGPLSMCPEAQTKLKMWLYNNVLCVWELRTHSFLPEYLIMVIK